MKRVVKEGSWQHRIALLLIVMFLMMVTGCADGGIQPVPEGILAVHFIDVGQGDATLLQGPDFTILIDAGRHDRQDVVPYLKKQGLREIDIIIGTHPHADHIGQMDKVIKEFQVGEVWLSGDVHTTQTFERVVRAIEEADVTYHEPRAGERYQVGSLILEIINPVDLKGNFHQNCIGLRAIYGDVKFLFTGDIEKETEEAIIERGHDLGSQILQLGHHGSSTSNTNIFLDRVSPELAIYSAGSDNSYGHPHTEVVERILARGIDLYGTDNHGTIIIQTDGQDYQLVLEK